MNKLLFYIVLAAALTTGCAKSLLFQFRAKRNVEGLEVVARQIQDFRIANYPENPTGILYWSTPHKKIYREPSYHFDYVHHKVFIGGSRCDSDCDSVEKYSLQLSKAQNRFLLDKFSINEVHSSTLLKCPDVYIIADSSVCFVNTGVSFLGFGKDHVLYIDLRETPRKELREPKRTFCSGIYCYSRSYRISDRIRYMIRDHNFYELPGSL
jgi:hypothetical protein